MDKEELHSELLEIFYDITPNGYEPRPGQIETAAIIIIAFEVHKKKHVVLDAPTGAGKSIIGMLVSTYYYRQELRSVLMTETKSLQDQYKGDFPRLFDIRGAGDQIYRCSAGFVRTDVECRVEASKSDCFNVNDCPRKRASARFFRERQVITNTHFTVNMPHLGNTHLGIIDECHGLENVIVGQKSLTIPKINFELIRYIILNETDRNQFELAWKEQMIILDIIEDKAVFNIDIYRDLTKALSSLIRGVESISENFAQLIQFNSVLKKAYSHSNNVMDFLQKLVTLQGAEFVKSSSQDLQPVYAKDFTDEAIFRKAKHFLHMSATVCGFEAYCHEVGIPLDEAEFVEIEHPIPADNRPVYTEFAAVMKYANYDTDIEKTVNKIDKLITENDQLNTIIHTASYKRAEDIASKSSHDIKVFKSHKEIIAYLREGNTGKFIASPSVMAGLDAKDDMCRLNIIAKVPFPSLADPRMKHLMTVDKKLYSLNVARNLVQACGRGTRGINDWSKTYIIDGSFENTLNYNKPLYPLWFRETVSM